MNKYDDIKAMNTDTYRVYDMRAPEETEQQRQSRIAPLVRNVSLPDQAYMDDTCMADDEKPQREVMIAATREDDIILVDALPNLGYPKEREELWLTFKRIGAKVRFRHKPSQKVWAVIGAISEVRKLDNTWKTASARKNKIRNSGGAPEGFRDVTRAAIAYRVATALLPSSSHTNNEIMEMINNALPDSCKPYNTGRYWQKQVRQYAVYIGKIEYDPILGPSVPLKLPKKEIEKFLRIRQQSKN